MSTVYEIGPFRLDAEASVLTHAGVPMALGPRGVAVLRTLVERPYEYVAKCSIIEAAWPGVVVEESNLAVQISAIRRVLAHVPGGEHWIETLARRGYRFVGPVTGARDRQPKDAGPESKRSNLPQPLTSFVGREREIVELKRLLSSQRLSTLVGVGGIGKTRLALQVAAEVVDAYRDGVWLVELGAITDPRLVPSTVNRVLGVPDKAGAPLFSTLCSHLKTRQLLLLLDNCEHLRDACAALVDAVLRGTKEVTVIATGREPLRVAGEQIYALPTLSLPDSAANVDTIVRAEAVQLFVERAERQQSDFGLTPARARAVAELCIHLDGIPLALELAAARIRSLSVEQINARIDDRFRLLTGGSPTALPRQQTLRATLDWSYDLLAEQERVVLQRLAVFPGSFTLEAASFVACDASFDGSEVLDPLTQLVARSLVVVDTNQAVTRYRLLETTRAYALEKLGDAGEIDAVRRRHARYYRDRFAEAPDDWLRRSDLDWRADYEVELDNVRVALDWAFGMDGDAVVGTVLAGGSGPLWTKLLLRGEGQRRLEAALARVNTQTPELDHARLWLWLGIVLGEGLPAQAIEAKERAIALYRRLGDAAGLGFSLVQLGYMLPLTGRFARAEAAFAEAFPLLDQAGLPKALGRCFECYGLLQMRTGKPAEARGPLEKALALYRGVGADDDALNALCNIADVTWALGDLEGAAAGFERSVALVRKASLPSAGKLGLNLINLAGVLTEQGNLDRALVAAREALPLLNCGGMGWIFLDHVALRAALSGKTANAARISGYADSIFATRATSRQFNEERAHHRLRALLRDSLAADELARLLGEGSKLSEDEACQLALED